MSTSPSAAKSHLKTYEIFVFCGALPLWLIVFLAGTLVSSAPYRTEFIKLDGVVHTLVTGVKVAATYTLTNVCILCLLASLLGMVGAKVQLGTDSDRSTDCDSTEPCMSALLRGFFIYLALIAGVMVLSESPTEPTQIGYVKLAGLMSLVGFVVNYRPTLFGKVLARAFPVAKGGGGGGG